jgi:hypothetical protein
MPDTISETEACDLLTRLFRARGYAIARNVQFREYGVEFHIDGWDAKARVGFEFHSSEDDDHDDLTLTEYNALTTAQRRGDLSLFVIDEVEPVSKAALAAEANEFLDEVAAATQARLAGPRRTGLKKAAKKPVKKAAKKTARTTAKKVAKKAAKKPVKTLARKRAKKRSAKR